MIEDEPDDDIDFIPLKNLPQSDLIVRYLNPDRPDGSPDADNVLTFACGHLEEVSLVGVSKDGQYYFASSKEDINSIVADLKAFYMYLSSIAGAY